MSKLVIPNSCPICDSLTKAFWKEEWRRDWNGNNIPYQTYYVQCTDLTCYAATTITHDHRSPLIERACITAWNNIPRDYLE